MVKQNLPSYTLYVVSTSDETTQCGICVTSNKNLHWASGGDVWAKNCIFLGGGTIIILLENWSFVRQIFQKADKQFKICLHDSKISSFLSLKILSVFLKGLLIAPIHSHLQGGGGTFFDKAKTRHF